MKFYGVLRSSMRVLWSSIEFSKFYEGSMIVLWEFYEVLWSSTCGSTKFYEILWSFIKFYESSMKFYESSIRILWDSRFYGVLWSSTVLYYSITLHKWCISAYLKSSMGRTLPFIKSSTHRTFLVILWNVNIVFGMIFGVPIGEIVLISMGNGF